MNTDNNTDDNRVYTRDYFLVAGDADAQQELPLTSLVRNFIEVASLHANALGFGHTAMAPMGLGWVLSRLSVEMTKFPAINRNYRVMTWIESWTRHYSERCFEVQDEDGTTLGYARTVWMVIDTVSHSGATTERLCGSDSLVMPRPCPIARMRRLPVFGAADEGVETSGYTYRLTDIDFYRHVNTVKHIRTLLDTYDMDVMDRCRIARADFAFMHEGRYGMTVSILRRGDTMRVLNPSGETVIAARLIMAPRC